MLRKLSILIFLIESSVLLLFPEAKALFNDDLLEFEGIFLKFLESAKHSIKLVSFNLDHRKIEDVLKKKAKEIDVFVVVDDRYKNKVKYLEDFGVHIICDERSDENKALIHSKFVIVDDSKVWFGSANLTESSFSRDHNFAFVSDERWMVDAFRKEFENFLEGKFHNEKDRIMGSSKSDMLVFSPKNDVMDIIVREISRTKRKVYISMYAFTNELIMDQLKVLSSNGVEVMVMYDESWNKSSEYSVIEDGREYILTIADPFFGLLHDKFILIDPEKRCSLICGSYNLTLSANRRNDEFVFITHDKKLCEIFKNEFEEMLKY